MEIYSKSRKPTVRKEGEVGEILESRGKKKFIPRRIPTLCQNPGLTPASRASGSTRDLQIFSLTLSRLSYSDRGTGTIKDFVLYICLQIKVSSSYGFMCAVSIHPSMRFFHFLLGSFQLI